MQQLEIKLMDCEQKGSGVVLLVGDGVGIGACKFVHVSRIEQMSVEDFLRFDNFAHVCLVVISCGEQNLAIAEYARNQPQLSNIPIVVNENEPLQHAASMTHGRTLAHQEAHREKMLVLGELSCDVAHEINNPLSVIMARVSLMQEWIDEHASLASEVKQEILEKLQSVSKSATRIQKIVRSLYRFSRNESEEPEQCVLATAIVQDTLDLCLSRFVSHGIELRYTPPPELWQVRCRQLEVSQILLNLLTNAFDVVSDFSPARSCEKWVEVSIQKNGSECVEIRVSNGGTPLSPEMAETVFKAYFTTKLVGRGTGLGLSISRALAQKNNGELFVDTVQPNTVFVLRFLQAASVTTTEAECLA